MARNIRDILAEMPAERRARIEARAEELIAEELTLRDLRRALDLTQERLAAKLGVRQETISRLERRHDLLLSTLRDHVAAMGGELELVARFPGRPPVRLTGLDALAHGDEDRRPLSRPRRGRREELGLPSRTAELQSSS